MVAGYHAFHGVLRSIALYMACSSLMLVANKVAVFHIPLPGLVCCAQLVFSSFAILALKSADLIRVDALTFAKSKSFSPYVACFVLSAYTNVKVLEHSNVETAIVFRACSPLIVSFLDWLYLGREIPDTKSMISLVVIVIGSMGYVYSDSEFAMKGIAAYWWAFAYMAALTFAMTEGKRMLSQNKFESAVWGSSLYQNILGIAPLFCLALMAGEGNNVGTFKFSPVGGLWLGLTCVVGLAISYTGWDCRNKTSATTFTVVGVACKLLTLLINIMVWDKHATPVGTGWLVLCIVAGFWYRQAPLRDPPVEPSPVPVVKELGEVAKAAEYGKVSQRDDADLENPSADEWNKK